MEVETTPPKASKPVVRKKRSWLWTHFSTSEKDIAVCSLCEAEISFKDGTNKMKGHLYKNHTITKPDDSPKKLKVGCNQQEILECALYVHCSCKRKGLFYLHYRATYFADCHIPLSTVESASFQNLMLIALPSFKVPSRHVLRDIIVTESAKVMQSVYYFFYFYFSLHSLRRLNK